MSNTLDTSPLARPPKQNNKKESEPKQKSTLIKRRKKAPSGWEMSASDALHVNYVDSEINTQ